MVIVQFYCMGYMRLMFENNICIGIYYSVGKFVYVIVVFIVVGFVGVWYMLMFGFFCFFVEGNDDYIVFCFQFIYDFLGFGVIVNIYCV